MAVTPWVVMAIQVSDAMNPFLQHFLHHSIKKRLDGLILTVADIEHIIENQS